MIHIVEFNMFASLHINTAQQPFLLKMPKTDFKAQSTLSVKSKHKFGYFIQILARPAKRLTSIHAVTD